MARAYYVYIMASGTRVLYTGMTSRLVARVNEHRTGALPGFTRRYRVNRLVWYEGTGNALAAAAREREIKSWCRLRKIRLVETSNPAWLDLAAAWFDTGAGG